MAAAALLVEVAAGLAVVPDAYRMKDKAARVIWKVETRRFIAGARIVYPVVGQT